MSHRLTSNRTRNKSLLNMSKGRKSIAQKAHHRKIADEIKEFIERHYNSNKEPVKKKYKIENKEELEKQYFGTLPTDTFDICK